MARKATTTLTLPHQARDTKGNQSMTSQEVTVEAGRALFEAGCTIMNAERFGTMASLGPIDDTHKELCAYFNWERSCLIAYAHSLSVIQGTASICTSITSRREYEVCRGTVAALPDGRYKCIGCGAVYATEDYAEARQQALRDAGNVYTRRQERE